MQLPPAVAFAAASGGGGAGAFLALPAAAIIRAMASTYVRRHDDDGTELTRGDEPEDEGQRGPAGGLAVH